MKSFQEFITEIFDSSYEFDGPRTKMGYIKYVFRTDQNQEGVVMFDYDDEDDEWYLQFSIDGKHHITNKGEAIKIFSTVNTIIKDFVTNKKPKKLIFMANKNEQSRVSLYQKLTDSFARKNQLKWQKLELSYEIAFIINMEK